MKRILLLVITIVVNAAAQEFSKAIEDNSYFIEEAYNQEDGVVQHIFNGAAHRPGNSTEASFTQEWPAFGRAHQLSITLPYTSNTAPAASGIGDVMINYRYQAIDEPGLAFSPRLSLILPTGNSAQGLGTGKPGLQLNLPYSKRFSEQFIFHGNIGATLIPEGVTIGTAAETYSDLFIGGSSIWLLHSHFNVMLEVLHMNSGSTSGRSSETIVSPGLRYAIDVGELQIVPGLAFPFSFTAASQTNGIFLYLSFEHFF